MVGLPVFPDLTRDDVFRLETPRLWLRWPVASDASALAAIHAVAEVACQTSLLPQPYSPQEVARFILETRQANAAGTALHLVATPLRQPRQPLGMAVLTTREDTLHLSYWLHPAHWGRGLGTEAGRALVQLVWSLTDAAALEAATAAGNGASCRVLAKLGFRALGETDMPVPAPGGTLRILRHRLDRPRPARHREPRHGAPAIRLA